MPFFQFCGLTRSRFLKSRMETWPVLWKFVGDEEYCYLIAVCEPCRRFRLNRLRGRSKCQDETICYQWEQPIKRRAQPVCRKQRHEDTDAATLARLKQPFESCWDCTYQQPGRDAAPEDRPSDSPGARPLRHVANRVHARRATQLMAGQRPRNAGPTGRKSLPAAVHGPSFVAA